MDEKAKKLEELIKQREELSKQREELDKLIFELSERPQLLNTNIPYTSQFIAALGIPPDSNKQSSNISSETVKASILNRYSKEELLKMKLFVNKKCNQISTDYQHTQFLIDEMMEHRENQLFREIFTHKLIEQGKVQVSSHFESYKPLSYILVKLGSQDVIKLYAKLMVTREGNEAELKGIYAIYFGFLNLKEDAESAWFWIASVLNCGPNNKTGYILEVFLIICGEMLFEKCGVKFQKLLKYTKTHFLKELGNQAVITRLEILLEKYLKNQ